MDQIVFDFLKPETSTDWKWSFKDYPEEKNGLKVFSCFSCGGGSTMGYKLAGCEVVGNCEIDKRMNDIYNANHHPKYSYCMDIRDFNQLQDIPEELYNLDILDGSPPCTTFSSVGKREETWGKKKKFREGQAEQTLDDLSFIFIETVNKLKPKCVIMENVEGLLLGNAWQYVQDIYKDFGDIGYDVEHYLLKGETMGVPQTRHRVFFIAFRKDLHFDFSKLHMSFNYEPITYGTIKSGSGRQVGKDSQAYMALCLANEQDKSIGDVLERIGKKRTCYSDKIVWENSICPTIKSSLHHYRGMEKTYISCEDIINAQTFPSDYDFGNYTFTNVAYICGMSVPPVMIKRIVNRIIETGIFQTEGD